MHATVHLISLLCIASLDYEEVTTVLNFSSEVRIQTVVVAIENDGLLEADEVFTAVLEVENIEDIGRVVLQPYKTTIAILDDDSEYVV